MAVYVWPREISTSQLSRIWASKHLQAISVCLITLGTVGGTTIFTQPNCLTQYWGKIGAVKKGAKKSFNKTQLQLQERLRNRRTQASAVKSHMVLLCVAWNWIHMALESHRIPRRLISPYCICPFEYDPPRTMTQADKMYMGHGSL